MSRYRSLCWSNGGHGCCFRVDNSLSFLDLFLRSSRKSNEFFLGAANAISRLEITEVSIVGKHSFFVSKQAWKSCHVEQAFEILSFGRVLGNRDRFCDYQSHSLLNTREPF